MHIIFVNAGVEFWDLPYSAAEKRIAGSLSSVWVLVNNGMLLTSGRLRKPVIYFINTKTVTYEIFSLCILLVLANHVTAGL
jgi:hypothetical protein